MVLVKTVFWVSVATLGYTWVGYWLVLRVLAAFRRGVLTPRPGEGVTPDVTVIVTAYDEGPVIAERIRNLLEQDYPRDRLEILIGSDGSTDETPAVVRGFEGNGVRLLHFEENRGRADVHNDTVKAARGEIVVFTDADTTFELDFVRRIVAPFADARVGAAVGRLVYRTGRDPLAQAEGVYWRYELALKDLENRLGIVNNGTGACMAIRRGLFGPLTPVDDVDTATVVDIILAGYRVEYVATAVAYDIPPRTAAGEWRMRVRGTSKTVSSLLRRGGPGVWLRHPVLLWSTLSHRGLRWVSAVPLLGALATSAMLMGEGGVYGLAFWLQAGFYALATIGAAGNAAGVAVQGGAHVFGFCVATAGMTVGVFKALRGRAPTAYKTTD